MATNNVKDKITQDFMSVRSVNTISLTNITQYFIPKVFYSDIYVNITATGDTLRFYDTKLLKEMDSLTLRQLERR